MTKIAVLVGSLRKDSINKQFAKELEAMLPKGVTFDYVDVNFPLYNGDLEATDFPAEVQRAKDVIEAADGVLFVTPEYNRSFPGVLKNAIDWISRPYGTHSFAGKPVATAGVSGALATTQAQHALRSVLLFLNTKVMGQPEMYVDHQRVHDEDGRLTAQAVEMYQRFLTAFLAHVARG